jgi:hypothetical protein
MPESFEALCIWMFVVIDDLWQPIALLAGMITPPVPQRA